MTNAGSGVEGVPWSSAAPSNEEPLYGGAPRTSTPERATIGPGRLPARWEADVPGSKSLTNRAVLLASLAAGESLIQRPLVADDTLVMRQAVRDLGASIDESSEGLVVRGCGRAPIAAPDGTAVWCGMAGTAARFLLPVCAAGRGRFASTPTSSCGGVRWRRWWACSSAWGHAPVLGCVSLRARGRWPAGRGRCRRWLDEQPVPLRTPAGRAVRPGPAVSEMDATIVRPRRRDEPGHGPHLAPIPPAHQKHHLDLQRHPHSRTPRRTHPRRAQRTGPATHGLPRRRHHTQPPTRPPQPPSSTTAPNRAESTI
jgi:hypothetical protein